VATHGHNDHINAAVEVADATGAPIMLHPDDLMLWNAVHPDRRPEPLHDGQLITVAGITLTVLHTPGHSPGAVSLHAPELGVVFTGDTLFKGSVGGVRAPGHTSYADLRSSIMDTLLTLPPTTTIHPGHTDPTTVAEELETNTFVRIWRGLDPEGSASCTAMGEPATLILLGDDYDGGYKAWVRWPDGSDDIVPGSQVQGAAGVPE